MFDVKTEGGIAVIAMAQGKANALDIELCNALVSGFTALRGAEIRAVVLTGHGTMFCAGVDLKRLSDGGEEYVRKFLPALHRLYDAVFHFPKPLVAAINGHAIAGGAVLAACADRRVMAREAGRIGVTELRVGVPFPALAFEIVRFAVPPRYLTEFMLGSQTYATDAALHKGWIDEVVEPAELMSRAFAIAQDYAALSPAAFAQTKMQIRQEVTERVRHSGAATDRAVTEIWAAPGTLGYIRDYVENTLQKT